MLPDLKDFEDTRRTLQLYSRAVDMLPRVHGIKHPRWEHVSLAVTSRGMQSDPVPIPSGGYLSLVMDLRKHRIIVESSTGEERIISMTSGLKSTSMGDALIAAAAEYGLEGDYPRERFEDQGERRYVPERAETFFQALIEIDRVFRKWKAELGQRTSPVQFWTHGFDLSIEWYGTRLISSESGQQQAQLNLGFFPGGPETEPYFYSNPWPFETDQLVGHSLPDGARWHQEGWEGTLLPYRELVGAPDFEERLLDYARAVYGVAAPILNP